MFTPLPILPLSSVVLGSSIFAFGSPTSFVGPILSVICTLWVQHLLISIFSLSPNFIAAFHLLLSPFTIFGGRGGLYILILQDNVALLFWWSFYDMKGINTSHIWLVYLEAPLFTLLSLGNRVMVISSEIQNFISIFKAINAIIKEQGIVNPFFFQASF